MNRVVNRTVKRTKGFTLVELMLAMMFISVLLVAIAVTVVRISSVYNRGVALKALNQSSRDIASDLRNTALGANLLNLDEDYTLVVVSGKVVGGRLCFGNYSYIWNTAYAIQTNSSGLTRYAGNSKDVRFVKVPDSGQLYCARNAVNALRNPNILSSDYALAQELINKGDFNLGVSSFSVTNLPSATDSAGEGSALYTINYTLSAGDYTAMNADQTACKTASEAGADVGYCNVQAFSMVIRHASSI